MKSFDPDVQQSIDHKSQDEFQPGNVSGCMLLREGHYQDDERFLQQWVRLGRVAEENTVHPVLDLLLLEAFHVEYNQENTLTRKKELMCYFVQLLNGTTSKFLFLFSVEEEDHTWPAKSQQLNTTEAFFALILVSVMSIPSVCCVGGGFFSLPSTRHLTIDVFPAPPVAAVSGFLV